jgi:O-6-methylguanine DNA methyltransferase
MTAGNELFKNTMHSTFIHTFDGLFRAHFSNRGLVGLEFPRARPEEMPHAERRTEEVEFWIELTRESLTRALEGKAPRSLPPFDLESGTSFQRSVWEALANIPLGQTRSYKELAVSLGRPRATRAVGQACGANPIPVLIPCHRVLAAGGRLGGFSGGLDWKRKLLAREVPSQPHRSDGSWAQSLLFTRYA